MNRIERYTTCQITILGLLAGCPSAMNALSLADTELKRITLAVETLTETHWSLYDLDAITVERSH
jgi:hypothetical protein